MVTTIYIPYIHTPLASPSRSRILTYVFSRRLPVSRLSRSRFPQYSAVLFVFGPMLASVLSALPPGLHFFLNSDFVDIFAPAGLSFTHLSYVCHYWITLDTPRKAARLQGAPGPPFPPLPTNTRRRQPTASGSTNVAQPRDQPPHIPDVERSLPPSLPAERWRSRPPSITSESTSSLTESTHSLETSRPHMSRL